MRKRILFKSIDVTTKVVSDSQQEEGDISDNSVAETALDSIGFNLRFSGETLSGYEPKVASTVIDACGNVHPSMGGWPSREVNFNVTDEDIDRVNGWITGDYHGAEPESDKLIKNYQTTINDLLSGYFTTALNHNLFTSPCRLAWCAVYGNGERGRLREMGVNYPNVESPNLPISSMVLRNGRFYSKVDIRNVPSALEYSIGFSPDIDFDSLGIDRIEVYATQQVPFRDSKMEVYGIRTMVIDGAPVRCWSYEHNSTDEIGIFLREDSIFRLLSSIKSEDLKFTANDADLTPNWQKIPIPSGKLAHFSQSKIYKSGFDETSQGGSLEEPSETEKRVLVETSAFCLDEPERDKHIRRVSLFGIFPRKQDKFRFIIYGSHHREDWHKLAESNVPYITGLRAVPYRWFKICVETQLRQGDFLEAATVEYN